MKKLEEIINVATNTKMNLFISVLTLLVLGYIIGFVMIKLA